MPWVMLGGGMTIGLIGLTQINLADCDGPINDTPGTILIFTGLGSAHRSIITILHFLFLIYSSGKKKETLSLSLKKKNSLYFPESGLMNKATTH